MAFEGFAAHDPARESRGTVLIVHDWDGMTEYEENRARMLAEAGYTAFAVDVYGAETDPQGVDEYRALSGALYADREMFRERLMGSIMAAADIPGATEDMVIIGYCFGGAAVLEAARAGADLEGFVSFHGGLPTPEGQDWSMATGAPIHFFHGSADPVSGIDDLAQVMTELVEADIPHQAEIYGGARHSFTVPGSDDYLENADEESWEGLMEFLGETL
jgi:dienelactone hydrolase